jgi:hypothetical protein
MASRPIGTGPVNAKRVHRLMKKGGLLLAWRRVQGTLDTPISRGVESFELPAAATHGQDWDNDEITEAYAQV